MNFSKEKLPHNVSYVGGTRDKLVQTNPNHFVVHAMHQSIRLGEIYEPGIFSERSEDEKWPL
jgi:hypothetical protein